MIVRAAKPFKILGVDGLGSGLTVELPAAVATAGAVRHGQVRADASRPRQPQLRIRTDLGGGFATLPVEAEAITK